MTGGHVDAEVPMVVPLDIFTWRNNQLFQLCGWHKLFLGAPLLTEQTGVNLLSRRPPLLVRLQQREGALERKVWILPKSELRDLV